MLNEVDKFIREKYLIILKIKFIVKYFMIN